MSAHRFATALFASTMSFTLAICQPVRAAEYAPYQDKLMIPSFIADTRQFILTSIANFPWTVTEEKPGQVKLQLLHSRLQTKVLANVWYGPDFIRVELVAVEGYKCSKRMDCPASAAQVETWMINLRQQFGIELLYAAIENAGGTVPRPAADPKEPATDSGAKLENN